jgi:hypothetical protein
VVLQVRAMYSLVKSAISHDERHYSLHCDACISGDLTIATRLFTQDICADDNDYNSYVNCSFVEARNSNWDHALDDGLKVRYIIPS